MWRKSLLLFIGIISFGLLSQIHNAQAVILGIAPASSQFILASGQTTTQVVEIWRTDILNDETYKVTIDNSTAPKTLISGPSFIKFKKGEITSKYSFIINTRNVPVGKYEEKVTFGELVSDKPSDADGASVISVFPFNVKVTVVKDLSEITENLDTPKTEKNMQDWVAIKNLQTDKQILFYDNKILVTWDLTNESIQPVRKIPYTVEIQRDLTPIYQKSGMYDQLLAPQEQTTTSTILTLANFGTYTIIIRIGNISDRISVIKIEPFTFLLHSTDIILLIGAFLMAVTIFCYFQILKLKKNPISTPDS